MTRAASVFLVILIAGCGSSEPPAVKKPGPKVVKPAKKKKPEPKPEAPAPVPETPKPEPAPPQIPEPPAPEPVKPEEPAPPETPPAGPEEPVPEIQPPTGFARLQFEADQIPGYPGAKRDEPFENEYQSIIVLTETMTASREAAEGFYRRELLALGWTESKEPMKFHKEGVEAWVQFEADRVVISINPK